MEELHQRIVEYHTRKGIRKWCSCTYCVAKRRGTAEIMFGLSRTNHGYLSPGYRAKKEAHCFCTDGCAGRPCDATKEDSFSRLRFYPDFEWRRLPPNDNLDEAIRNRNERVREQLRIKLRYQLNALKQGESYDRGNHN